MKLKELFQFYDQGRLVLPNFQRDFEWKEDQQIGFLSSVLTALPIGSLLILQGKKGDFATKQLCFIGEIKEQKDECLYLLDGQQRISTLRSIFSDIFGGPNEWEENFDLLYRGLRSRWFLKVTDNEEDVFGYEKLSLKKLNKLEPGQIKDCIVVKSIFKKNRNEWYHPNFCRNEKNEVLEGHKLKNEIARKAADEGLIPLYDIYNLILHPDETPLLDYVLEELARKQVSNLKAMIRDGVITLEKLLKEDQINKIREIDQEKREEEIHFALLNLAAAWKNAVLDYLKSILDTEIHVIQLPSDEISRATAIYENINVGGISLDTYDLIVAKAARIRSEKSLTQRIINQLNQEIELSEALTAPLKGKRCKKWSSRLMKTVDENKLSKKFTEQYLNLLSIYSFVDYGNVQDIKVEHIKRNKILELDHEKINDNTEKVVDALVRAHAFLQFRCGKVNINDLSYQLMILPLAFSLIDDKVWNSKSCLAKLEYWYWASLFGGSYRENQNVRCIEDIKNLYNWVKGAENPFEARYHNILKVDGYSNETVLMHEDPENGVPKAIYNGILEYVLSNQPKDFVPNKEILINAWDISAESITKYNGADRPMKVHVHHIFPLGAATSIGESSKKIRNDKKHILNSPLNVTRISDYANNLIKDQEPQKYLEYISDVAPWDHCIPTSWDEKSGESNEDYYKRLLKGRYEMLLLKIKDELSNLAIEED